MSGALAYQPDRYEIPLHSSSVSRLYVESGCDLYICADGPDTAIRIAGPIAVVTENPRALVDFHDQSLAPRTFGKIVVSRGGLCHERQLDILFDSHVWFWVEPHCRDNVWGPRGSKGLVIICMPSGELALWFGLYRRRPAADEEEASSARYTPAARL
jgi:hypothetical protein